MIMMILKYIFINKPPITPDPDPPVGPIPEPGSESSEKKVVIYHEIDN